LRLNHRAAGRLLPGLMLLILSVAPTQWSLPLPGRVHLTLADLLLAIAVPVGLCAGLRLRRLPLAHLLFLGLTALSVLLAAHVREAVKEWMQLALYFGAGTLLAEAALRQVGGRGLRVAVGTFLAAGGFIVGLALAQYWLEPSDQPLLVRGTFGNRNVLGGYLALLLPLAFGLLLQTASVWLRLGLALLVLAGLSVCLSGPALLAIALVLLALAARRGAPWLMGTGVVLMVGFTLLLPRMPRANDYEAFSSMALYDTDGQPTRRYPEWQAAAVMALERPWVGQGPGNYQKRIGPFYGVVPNATGPAEPDIQNLYLVLAATAGLPACFAFLLMLWGGIADAAQGSGARDDTASCAVPGLGAGLAGALGAFALTAVWHPLLVRGIGLPLALLLAAARYRNILHEP
jgi:O-antigen ligase